MAIERKIIDKLNINNTNYDLSLPEESMGVGLSVDTSNKINFNIGKGLILDGEDNSIKLNLGTGLGFNPENNTAVIEIGDGLTYGSYDVKVKASSGITVNHNGVSVKLGSGLEFDSDGKIVVRYEMGGSPDDLQGEIDKVNERIDTLVNGSGDTTDVIDTFNEITDFLSGIENNETFLNKVDSINNKFNDYVTKDEFEAFSAYTPDEETTYINEATSLAEADSLLDTALTNLSYNISNVDSKICVWEWNGVLIAENMAQDNMSASFEDIQAATIVIVKRSDKGIANVVKEKNIVNNRCDLLYEEFDETTHSVIKYNISITNQNKYWVNKTVGDSYYTTDESDSKYLSVDYVSNTATTYISGATSLVNADNLLDSAISALSGKVTELENKGYDDTELRGYITTISAATDSNTTALNNKQKKASVSGTTLML